jgi:transcription regulator
VIFVQDIKFKYGDRLKELRKPTGYPERNLSMDDLCQKLSSKFNLKINKSMMSRWENGTAVPDNKHIVAYAKFFDIDMNYLIGLTNIKRKLSEINFGENNNLDPKISDIVDRLNHLDTNKINIVHEMLLKFINMDMDTLTSYNNIIK